MQILKPVNALRRTFMRKLTRHLGVTRLPSDGHQVMIKRILVCRPNHRLGNLLLLTPLLQEIIRTFPDAKIDLFLKGSVAPELLKNYVNVNRIILLPKKAQKNVLKYLQGWMMLRSSSYDLVVNAIQSSSSGRMSTQFANGKIKLLGDIHEDVRTNHPDYQHMAKVPVYSFRHHIKMLGFKVPDGVVPTMDLKLSKDEIAEGKRLLRDLVNNDQRTICIYTYATGQKCYPATWWNDFYELLKEKFPGYNILEVLPIENVSQVSFKVPSFYSKDLRQIGALISSTSVFIGADSGMMHLASACGAPVIGLFKAENIIQYAPYNHKSLGVHTGRVSQQEILNIVERLIMPVVPSDTPLTVTKNQSRATSIDLDGEMSFTN